jgi:sporulation integral membrane protein YlbJ
VSMILFPQETFEASKSGVSAWWNIVFPALLPFFVCSELLMGYGFVQFIGVFLEPIMRPLFNLPGTASFVLAVGYTSGFPVSASLTARLRSERLCTKLEAERLISFTNNASPLFLLVAVGVGMFHNSRIGILIATSHYLANLIIGLLLRFYNTHDPEYVPRLEHTGNLFKKALSEMKKAYAVNPRPLGTMLGDAVTASINKLCLIGGFIIVFAVIIKMLVVLAIIPVHPLSIGLFEITLGAKAVSETAAPLIYKTTLVAMILGWSGISILAQVSAMIGKTDITMGLFIIARICHSLLSGLMCYSMFCLNIIQQWLSKPVSTIKWLTLEKFSWINLFAYSCNIILYLLLFFFLTAVIVYLVRTFIFIRFKT